MIYGDDPQKINERQDALGLTSYTYVPQISAIVQSGNLYVYGLNNPVLYADKNGEWIHIVIGAVVGAAVSSLISVAQQYATTGKIDLGTTVIAAISGGISGGLASTGVGLAGQIIGNTLIGAGSNAADQLYQNNGNWSEIDITEVMINGFVGALSGAFGGSGGGGAYMDSLSKQFFTRVGHAFESQSGAVLKKELANALAYYAKSASTEMLSIAYNILKSSVPSFIKNGVEIINKNFKRYGIGGGYVLLHPNLNLHLEKN